MFYFFLDFNLAKGGASAPLALWFRSWG